MKSMVIVILSLFLSSCASVISTQPKNNEVQEGISYFLPKRLHKVKISVTPITADPASVLKAKQAYEKAAASKQLARQEFESADAAYNQAKKFAEKAEGEAKRVADEKMGLAKTDMVLKKAAFELAIVAESDAFQALSKLSALAKERKTKCNLQVSLSAEALPMAADEKCRFVANLRHYYNHSDHLTLKTTPAGLLSSTDSTSIDRTGEIIKEIAKAIAVFSGMPAPSFPTLKTLLPPVEKPEELPCLPFETEVVVDLSDPKQVKQINDQLETSAKGLKIVVCGYGLEDEFIAGREKPSTQGEPQKQNGVTNGENGLFYRRDLPYLLNLMQEERILANLLVFMPNLSPISRIPFTSGPFVTSKQTVEFTDGMLVSYDTDKPSEMLGVVSIPVEVAQSVMSVLTQFIRLRVDYASSQADLATKQLELIDLLNKIEEKEKAAQNASGR